jgi:hypothetical protein
MFRCNCRGVYATLRVINIANISHSGGAVQFETNTARNDIIVAGIRVGRHCRDWELAI